MTISAVGEAATSRRLATALSALTVTQMVGWGTTFHIPAVLSARISAGTGLPIPVVFGGITLMLIVAALISPAVGRRLDRDGAGRWMARGSLLLALGLLILSGARGPVAFALAFVVLGLAMPLALNQGASTALVQISPERSRRAIALLLLLTGLSSTIAWPVLIALDEALGWRGAVLGCAAAHIVACVPLHLLALPRGRVLAGARSVDAAGAPARAAPEPRRSTFLLAATAFSLSGMLTWGLPLHMIGLLEGLGHDEAAAVWIGSLLGPGQVLARAFEMAGGHRFGILAVGIGAAALMPLSLVLLLAWGTSPAGAVAFAVCYGLSAGLVSIVRAVAPLRLFGVAAYARILGRLGLPQNIAFASAPLGFAVLREQFGSAPVIWVSLGVATVALGATIALARSAPASPPA